MSIEVVSTLALLVLRVGAPMVVIMGLSFLAYRWLSEEKPGERRAEQATSVYIPGPAPMAQVLYNAAGQRCWDAHGCTQAMKANCPAVAKPELPCWLAIQMKTGHLKAKCTDCGYYDRPALRA
jgi:hypothetical protein